jgi:hypothetical protein
LASHLVGDVVGLRDRLGVMAGHSIDAHFPKRLGRRNQHAPFEKTSRLVDSARH